VAAWLLERLTETDNVHAHAGNVFAQLLQHVSKASWDNFQNNAYWWWDRWVFFSSSGLMQMTMPGTAWAQTLIVEQQLENKRQ